MDHLVPIAGIVCALAVAGGLAAALVQGLVAWRAFERLQRTAGDGLSRIAAGIERLEARAAEESSESTARLERACAGLAESLATVSVLLSGVNETRSLAGRVRRVVPTK